MEELEGSHRHMVLARAAIDYHETQIERYAIDCDWSQPGKYQTASSDQGVGDFLEPFARELEALDEPVTWIEKSDLEWRLGTSYFKAALYTPGCRLLNPAALVRGLAANLPPNVTLYENSPVIGIETGAKIKLSTAAERAALGCEENWGVTPANALASITMGFTNDHRILIRNNIYYNPRMRETASYQAQIARRHKRLFDQRFPMLPQVEMEYTWTGYVCLSHNGAPGFGKLADNVHTSVCQNAIGVAKGTAGGMFAADMACGIDNELIGYMQSLGQPNRLPARPWLDVGVKARREV